MNTLNFILAVVTDPTPSCPLHGTGRALSLMVVFSLLGTLMAVAAYKIFDRCTPGKLHEEIINNRNVAAAMIGAAVILGVCIIVAASMIG